MLLDRLFRRRPAQVAGRILYTALVDQARNPILYDQLRAPDTVEGRFELYTLHLVLIVEALRAGGEQGAETAQALFDTYAKSLDHALRELGVGDLSVGKKMRRLGEAIYGRARSYDAAFATLPDTAPLAMLLGRTVYADGDEAPVDGLLDYVLTQRRCLAAVPVERLLAGQVEWGMG